jgi:Outer membrane protein beta-barrel domain
MKRGLLLLSLLISTIVSGQQKESNPPKIKFLFGLNQTSLSLPFKDDEIRFDDNDLKGLAYSKAKYNAPILGLQVGLMNKIVSSEKSNVNVGFILKVRRSCNKSYAAFTGKYYFGSPNGIDSVIYSLMNQKGNAISTVFEVPFQFDFLIMKNNNVKVFMDIGLWGGIILQQRVNVNYEGLWSKPTPKEIIDRNAVLNGKYSINKFNRATFGALAGLSAEFKKHTFLLNYSLQTLSSKGNDKYTSKSVELSVLRPLKF